MNTKVNLAGVELKNPVMEASGTFGSGMEYGEFVDLNKLGAVVTKGVANVPWPGNPVPRIAEVYEFHHIGASAARDGHSCFLRMCMIHKVMY